MAGSLIIFDEFRPDPKPIVSSNVLNQTPTALELAQLAGVCHPVAIFRLGHTTKTAAWSNQRTIG